MYKQKKSFKRNFNIADEYYTPKILIEPLLKVLDDYFNNLSLVFGKESKKDVKNRLIYCPFDTKYSEYVIILKEAGYRVLYGDIKTGQDFFTLPIPKEIDLIVSNPPFSKKKRIFEKCFYSDKPFILLMNMMAINYDEINDLFRRVQEEKKETVQFLIPDKKVSFNGNTSSFNSGYVTWKVLKNTQFFHVENHNTGKDFTAAKMYNINEDRTNIDYDNLHEILLTRELSSNEISKIIGTTKSGSIAQCITTLSLKYPVWNPRHGWYKI